MKKKILFVIPTLKSGGAEKSLITLLQLFDYDKYDVSLFLFRKEGLFLKSVPEQVTVLDAGENHITFDGDAKNAVKSFLKKGRIDLVLSRYFYAKSLSNSDSYQRETKSWHWLKKSIKYPKEHFECVIGYLEGTADWLASEIQADKKIGYMHSYLDKTLSDKKNFSETINRYDYFVAVSDECLENLKRLCPNYDGLRKIHNIVSPRFIKNSAKSETPLLGDEIKLLTVGRLSFEKGLDMAVKACRILKDKNYKFKWYHVGIGPEKENIQSQIKENDLADTFILLGEKSNPYPYMNSCDIYVQPSRHEGKSIAIDEAKCLEKPIVVTNFPSVFDQIEGGVNGLICDMNAEAVADSIEKLILNPELRERFSFNLSNEQIGNEEEIQKLYELIEK